MFFALVYLLLRRLVGLTANSSSELLDTEVEPVVLRPQLKVLGRKGGRPRLRRRDRLVMAPIARVLPRARWTSFLVSPQTLLRRHRELVRRKWTFGRRSTGGRPPITGEVRDPHPPHGQGEPPVGVHPDQGRAGTGAEAHEKHVYQRLETSEPDRPCATSGVRSDRRRARDAHPVPATVADRTIHLREEVIVCRTMR